MQIHFESTSDCDYFYFFEIQESPLVRLPENISINLFITLIQSSLDQIKPVILLENSLEKKEISLSVLKSSHAKLVEHRYLFLNYSIRNSLSKLNQKEFIFRNFDEMANFFSHNLAQKL